MRHTVSHEDGGILRRWPDKTIKIAEWRTRALDPSMVGQTIDVMPYEALQLLQDQIDFARSDKLR
jgi:hypothetical protein